MAQIFHPSTNTLSKLTIFGALGLLVVAAYGLALLNRSSYSTQQNVARVQPVPFSHRHHAGELGIDCRYCHSSVERAGFAGFPPTKTCMSCHSQIWTESEVLEPVRASFRSNQSLAWEKIYDLPDFVYFDHSIHLAKGVGCETCHGRVDRMNLVAQASTLQMEWCLDCHRAPERFVRPREEVFTMGWQPPEGQHVLGPRLVREYAIEPRTDCSTCHR